MPTQNPRLTVTLKPSTSAQLREMSRLTGNSQSAMIAEILESSEPVFQRLIEVLSAAEEVKKEVRHKMASDLETAQIKMEKQLGLALETFHTHTGSLIDQVEAVRRRARRATPGEALARTSGARRARSTPPSNRGVRSTANPTTTQKKHNINKGSKNGQV